MALAHRTLASIAFSMVLVAFGCSTSGKNKDASVKTGDGGSSTDVRQADLPATPPMPDAVPPAPQEGAACDDGNPCTMADACKAGVCAGVAIMCQAKDACHDAGSCDPATGACSNPAKAEGAACDDGNLCTSGDICRAGVCAGGEPVV